MDFLLCHFHVTRSFWLTDALKAWTWNHGKRFRCHLCLHKGGGLGMFHLSYSEHSTDVDLFCTGSHHRGPWNISCHVYIEKTIGKPRHSAFRQSFWGGRGCYSSFVPPFGYSSNFEIPVFRQCLMWMNWRSCHSVSGSMIYTWITHRIHVCYIW